MASLGIFDRRISLFSKHYDGTRWDIEKTSTHCVGGVGEGYPAHEIRQQGRKPVDYKLAYYDTHSSTERAKK